LRSDPNWPRANWLRMLAIAVGNLAFTTETDSDGGVADQLCRWRRDCSVKLGGTPAALRRSREVAALCILHGRHGPVVDYQYMDAAEPGQQIAQAAVGAGHGPGRGIVRQYLKKLQRFSA